MKSPSPLVRVPAHLACAVTIFAFVALGAWLAVIAVALGGCVGVVRTRLDWVDVASEARTKAEVRARFGEPHRAVVEAGRDVWYYDLSEPGPSGRRPPTEGSTVVFALLTPIWWRTEADVNVRFTFEGEAVVAAAQLDAVESGFFCGANLVHGQLFVCGRMP